MRSEKDKLLEGPDWKSSGEGRHERRRTWRLRVLALSSLLLVFVHYWRSSARTLPSSTCSLSNLQTHTDDFDWNALAPSRALNWTDCYSQIGDFQCARLLVPLLYSDPSGGDAAVALIKYPSKYPAGHENYRGAILLNPGGPGSSGVASLLSNDRARSLQTILTDEFDLITFDPRGVGYTTPGLNTFNASVEAGKFFIQFPDNLNASESSLGEAYARSKILSDIVADRMRFVAERMSTPLVARDMLSIVEALGQEKLQYWGVSYGSVLGATFAAMFPDNVGRLVIDGVDDAEDYYKGLWANNLRDTDAALMDIYQACVHAGPSKCPIYEETGLLVKARVDRLLDRLKSEPVPFINSTNPGEYDVVDYALAREVIFKSLYTTHDSGADLTKGIAALERGDPAPIYAMPVRPRVDGLFQCSCPGGPVPPLERGFDVAAAIACGDVVEERNEDFGAVKEAYEEMARTMSSFADNWPMRVWCSVWKVRGRERFSGSFERPISTSHPLLLIGNTADPVTPLANAHKMSKSFKDSVVLTQNSSGHCSFAATSLCTFKAVRTYFVNGTLPEKGTVCEVDSSIFEEKQVDLGALGTEDREVMSAVEKLRKGYFVPVLGGSGRVLDVLTYERRRVKTTAASAKRM